MSKMKNMENQHQSSAQKMSGGSHFKTNKDIHLSKALSWVLRHGAPSLGLNMTTDGYIPVAAILASHVRKLNNYNEDDVRRIVATNDKQRFSLNVLPIMTTEDYNTYSFVEITDENDNCGAMQALCIRANQGHSTRGIVAEDLLTPIPSEELANLDTIIHGTTKVAWERNICNEGLNRMNRNHIHFAPGLPNSESRVISGIRKNCEIYIYIDGAKCAKDSVKFYRSANGVILSPGASKDGTLTVDYFSSVIDAKTKGDLLKRKEMGNKLPIGMADANKNNGATKGGVSSDKSKNISRTKRRRQSKQQRGDNEKAEREKQEEDEEKEKLVEDPKKVARKLKKTLRQIEDLKEKDPSTLNEEQLKKISMEENVQEKLRQIEDLKKKDHSTLNEE